MPKIKYGIDLGTTNSSIATISDNNPKIFITDTKESVMPSCVSFSRNKTVRVGVQALNDYQSEKKTAVMSWKSGKSNAFVEFKRGMGSDTAYESSYMKRSFSAEELSAEVLKKLKTFVPENISDIVITVPAKFTVNQKAATVKAAELAGFKHCELLQEPLAASFAYGLSADVKDGVWMVFDFGGGTFDTALVHASEGILQIFDTEGDSYLGGKDLDYAVAEKVIIPHLQENYDLGDILRDGAKKSILKDSLKIYAEKIRKELSAKDSCELLTDLGDIGCDDSGEDMVIDGVFTREQVFAAMDDLYQKAVDMCKNLLERNKIKKELLTKIILVGGPTFCPLVRDKLREQISPNLDCSVDPMTAVAAGAALYAQNIEATAEVSEQALKDAIKLEITYESMSVDESEWVAVKPVSAVPEGFEIELTRGDGAWSSGKISVDAEGNVAEIFMVKDRTNTYTVTGFDRNGGRVRVYPDSITVINGTKVASAVLPFNICYSYLNPYEFAGGGGINNLIAPFSGLEKNNPLPAAGRNDDRKAPRYIIANTDDTLTIPIYQADFTIRNESQALCYEHVTDIVVSGREIEKDINMGDPVHLTLKVDTSEMMELEAYFPVQDITVKKKVEINSRLTDEDATREIAKVTVRISELLGEMNDAGINTKAIERKLAECNRDVVRFQQGDKSLEFRAILQNVRQVLILADNYYLKHERELLKFFFADIKTKRVDPDEEEVWQEEYLTRIPGDDEMDTKDIQELRALRGDLVSAYNKKAARVRNAQVLQFWYESGFYRSFSTGKQMAPLLKQLKDIGFDNFDDPMYLKVVTAIEMLIPRESMFNHQGFLK